MVALSNAHTPQGGESLPTGQLSGSTSESISVANVATNGLSGESVRYIQQTGSEWFVLRATRGREFKAYNILQTLGGQAYVPYKHGLRNNGRKRRWEKIPLVPQLVFLYAQPKEAEKFVKDTPELDYLSYYYDHFSVGANGYNPPLTVPYNDMLNFIHVTSVPNEHVMTVSPEHVHYKSGDIVRIIDGDFAGVIGKVARVKGQQRVIVNLEGICLVATAYIPTDFIEKL